MKKEFYHRKVKKLYPLIEELLFCWFRYHMPRTSRTEVFSILDKIPMADEDLIFPIWHQKCMIVFDPRTSTERSVTLKIVSLDEKTKPDRRFAFMKKYSIKPKPKRPTAHCAKLPRIWEIGTLLFHWQVKNKNK